MVLSVEQVALATRNSGMPLELLREDVTPLGMHYLLIHYDIPAVDPASWRLRVHGRVRQAIELTLDDLRARPSVTAPVTMECAGNGRAKLDPTIASQPWLLEAVGTGLWTGTSLATLLDEAEPLDDAMEVVFTGADHGVEGGQQQSYARSLTLDEARRPEVLVAWGLNGVDLPPQHGYPARLLVPGWYGMTSVKWLVDVEVVDRPFDGYQQSVAYRMRASRDAAGAPVSRMAVRSLVVPPGVPDFFTRRRFVGPAPVGLVGRAWSGTADVVGVEISDDGGGSWQDAEVEPRPSPWAWQRWTCSWTPSRSGELELWCRATDATGATQPLEPIPNLGGYANNAVQRVPITVN